MTVVSDNIRNIAKVPSGSSVWFSSDLRTTDAGIVEPKWQEVKPDASGNITVDLTPGPAKVRFGGALAGDLHIIVPATGTPTLRSLISAALLIPPDSPVELLLAAVEQYFVENPVEGEGLDQTAVDARVKAVGDQNYASIDLVDDVAGKADAQATADALAARVPKPSAAGSSGQVLALASNGATQWIDPPTGGGGSVYVGAVEE